MHDDPEEGDVEEEEEVRQGVSERDVGKKQQESLHCGVMEMRHFCDRENLDRSQPLSHVNIRARRMSCLHPPSVTVDRIDCKRNPTAPR